MTAHRIEERIDIARPVEEVFAAWTTASALAQWFAPMAVTTPTVKLDFRVGGRYSIRMLLPDEQVFTTSGTFRQIEPNEKIVMTWRCDAFPDPETVVTVRFRPHGDGTTVSVLHERFENEPTQANHRQGWVLCLDRLRAVLET